MGVDLMRRGVLVPALLLAIALPLATVPGLFGLEVRLGQALGLAVFTIGFWATGSLPEHITAIAFFLAAMLLGAGTAPVVFAGFASTTFWLVFAGLVLGVAAVRTGIAERLATLLAHRLEGSYLRILGGILALAAGIAFLLPSTMGRVLLLLPIVLALAERYGFAEGSRGRTGMILVAVMGTYYVPAAILPANVPNLVLAGSAETLLGVSVQYGSYLLLHFPVVGVLKGLALVAVIAWLFPDRPDQSADRPVDAADRPANPAMAPLDGQARLLAILLGLTLTLWVTDFVHHVSPAWIGLAAALVCLLPVTGLVPPKVFSAQVNFASLFYIAGVLGLAALIADSGLSQAMSGLLLGVLPLRDGADALNYASLVGLSTLLGPVTTMPGLPATLTPITADLVASTGWSVEAVLMTQVLGFSTVLLPYQVPPMMVGMAMTGIRMAEGAKVTLTLAAVTVLALLPLNYLWWRALGMMPG